VERRPDTGYERVHDDVCRAKRYSSSAEARGAVPDELVPGRPTIATSPSRIATNGCFDRRPVEQLTDASRALLAELGQSS
jgi:hypothetical protein